MGPKYRKTEVRMWESALVSAIPVDLDFVGRQLGVAKDSGAGLSRRIKLRAVYKMDCSWEKPKGREAIRRLPKKHAVGAKMA